LRKDQICQSAAGGGDVAALPQETPRSPERDPHLPLPGMRILPPDQPEIIQTLHNQKGALRMEIAFTAAIIFFVGFSWGAVIMSLLCLGKRRHVPKVQGEGCKGKVNSNE